MRTLIMLAMACCLPFYTQADTDTADQKVKIVSWNIANLHHVEGEPLLSYAKARDKEDYERLTDIVNQLDADIFALQEIGSIQALEKIFPKEKFHFSISSRYVPDSENDKDTRSIYTAFAISKDKFPKAPLVTTYEGLSLSLYEYKPKENAITDRPTRAALVMDLKLGEKDIRLMNVHLKSGCASYSLHPVYDENKEGKAYPARYDCRVLKAQNLLLENWIEAEVESGKEVIIAGDFNRRLNVANKDRSPADHFWNEINDGSPDSLQLVKGPEMKDKVCWTKHERRYE